MDVRSSVPVPPPGCPAHGSGGRVPLYGPEFAADPQAYYSYLRHFGAAAPVELAPGVEATLVTDYSSALRLLQDSASFRKDSRRSSAAFPCMLNVIRPPFGASALASSGIPREVCANPKVPEYSKPRLASPNNSCLSMKSTGTGLWGSVKAHGVIVSTFAVEPYVSSRRRMQLPMSTIRQQCP